MTDDDDDFVQASVNIMSVAYLINSFILPFIRSAFIRPPDIVCRRTYILPGILSSFFIRRLISELAEPN